MKRFGYHLAFPQIILPIILFFSCQLHASSKEIDLVMSAGDVKIGGTLLIPSKPRNSSLVIMSSGSGPQDRDETLFGFKIFKVIAEHLASQGIATFRYDDRGVGSSTGDFVNSTLDDLSNDVENIILHFQQDQKHRFNEFILFGHSQGGIVTGKVAARNSAVQKLILMASPAVPLGDLVLSQLRLDYSGSELNKALIESEVSSHAKLMHALYEEKNLEKAANSFKDSYTQVLKSQADTASLNDKKINKLATDRTNEHKMVYALPSLASFIYYDPVEDLKKLKIPVLSLVGGRDAQVSIEQNKDRMENALLSSGTQYHFEVLNEANHFFQKANTGLKDEYDYLDKAFVDGFLHKISMWILNN